MCVYEPPLHSAAVLLKTLLTLPKHLHLSAAAAAGQHG